MISLENLSCNPVFHDEKAVPSTIEVWELPAVAPIASEVAKLESILLSKEKEFTKFDLSLLNPYNSNGCSLILGIEGIKDFKI